MKLNYIDALRGIAVLLVILVHVGQYTTNIDNKFAQQIIENGARGVQLFFVASAFTLFLSYSNRYKNENNLILNYTIRRFFRIAPMYYLGIIYFIFQNGLGPRYWLADQLNITYTNILANILFLHGIYPYWINSVVPGGWSITVEIFFYTLVPLLFKYVTNTNRAILFFSTCFIGSLAMNYILKNMLPISSERLWNEFLFLWFPNQLPVFALGILGYFLVIKRDYVVNPFNLFLMLIFAFLHLNFSFIPNHIQFGLLFLVLIVILSVRGLFFINKFTIEFGKVSYSAYLSHFAILFWLNKLGFLNFIKKPFSLWESLMNLGCNFLIVLVITYLISKGLVNLIEKPFQKFGVKLIEWCSK